MKVIVVGGGFAGLAAATRLADEEHEVLLVERRPILGGRAYSIVDETTGDVVDNGQHLLMGCYRATRNFLSRIGRAVSFEGDLDVALADGSERIRVRAAKLPPPLHLLGGLFLMPLSLRDRLSLLKLAASLKLPTARLPEPSDWETVEAWLDRTGQSPEARRRLWYPLSVATLNDDPRTASAKMLGAVVKEALFGTRQDAQLLAPPMGLSQLYVEPAKEYLAERKTGVRTDAPVEKLLIEGRGGEAVVRGVELRGGERLIADAVIAAVPPTALSALIPDEVRAGEPYFENLSRLSLSPIVSVHLWLDSPVPMEKMLGLVDRPIHWIFDRGTHLSLVTSAARELVDRDVDQIVQLALVELGRAIPAAARARLRHARVLKEREATIAHAAGSEVHRPRARSPVAGLFVAGDFVRTGLPATIESAVRAADEACALIADYRPPERSPSGTPGLVPPGRLKRVTAS